jgi:phosphatidylserine decarboxylase
MVFCSVYFVESLGLIVNFVAFDLQELKDFEKGKEFNLTFLRKMRSEHRRTQEHPNESYGILSFNQSSSLFIL